MASNPTLLVPEVGEVAIEDEPMPEIGPTQVLIETEHTLIHSPGTWYAYIFADYQSDGFLANFVEDVGYPLPGDGPKVGRVVEIGEEVTAIEAGDRILSSGIESQARYVAVDADSADTVPESISELEALLFPTTATVALRQGRVDWGESVAVFGLGIIGQMTVRMAHFAGARPVVGINRSRPRVDLLPDLPGVVGVSSSEEGWVDEVLEANGGEPVDVVIEATGNAEAIPEQFEVLKEGGRFVVAGSPRDSTDFDFYKHCHHSGYELIGAHSPSVTPQSSSGDPWPHSHHRDLYFEIVGEPSLSDLDRLVDTYPAERGPEAFEALWDRDIDGVTIAFEW